jgi:hypothetical protein
MVVVIAVSLQKSCDLARIKGFLGNRASKKNKKRRIYFGRQWLREGWA